VSVADVLKAGGILDPTTAIAQAAATGLPIALAAAVLEQESGGGRNIWGHDPVEHRGVYVPGGLVTEQAYRVYKRMADTGEIGRQGVGPMQLTGRSWQDAADRRGGCWNPAANMAAGFAGLVALTNSHGLPEGVRRYNGSGPAAERYRDQVLARYRVWTTRLASTTPDTTSEGDDLEPDERAALMELRDGLRAAGIGKGRLPGRGEVMKSITDDPYGWTLNGAGKAGEALAEVQRLRADLAAGKLGGGGAIDYDQLAAALLRQMSKPA
jgi:hypothetical protein